VSGDGDALLVVIVNYRTPDLVIACLASLAGEVARFPDVRVAVVDNASGDGSAGRIAAAITEEGWGGWASVRESPVNGGFSYGNNLAIRPWIGTEAGAAGPSLFWMLNPDTVVQPGAIGAILSFMQAHPQAGVIGTGIMDEAGERWPFAFRFPSLASELEGAWRLSLLSRLLARRALAQRMGAAPAQVDWLSGASIVVRRAVFETAGLLDEDYFLYFEETDFFHRVAAAGWERWYVPQAVVMHIAGQSTGVTGKGAARRRVPAYWFASRRRYLLRNHGRLHAIAADLIVITGTALWRLRCWLLRRRSDIAPHFLWDFIRRSAIFHGDAEANVSLAAFRTRPVGGSVSP
jgi:GT2 family glycosyltransferase